jgi:hypothetical protein
MKKRLSLKKVTIRNLDESVLDDVAGAQGTQNTACNQGTCSSTCPFTCGTDCTNTEPVTCACDTTITCVTECGQEECGC